MIKIDLPWWMSGTQLLKLRDATRAWWALAESWVTWHLSQFDPLTCNLFILNLWAFQRDVVRFKNEPEELFRLRVKLAFINASDSGSKQGFEAIFGRLGNSVIETLERKYAVDWDVIILKMSQEQIASYESLVWQLIRWYGRTCKRYEIGVDHPTPLYIAVGVVEFEKTFSTAGIGEISAVMLAQENDDLILQENSFYILAE